MIRVVAVLTAKPGLRDELLAVFQANVPNVRAENGCIEYAAHVDADGIGPLQTKFGPDTFAVLEFVGEPGGAERSRRHASHAGLWAEEQGSDREPRGLRSLRDRLGGAPDLLPHRPHRRALHLLSGGGAEGRTAADPIAGLVRSFMDRMN